jgi:hypothetical protein
MRQWKKKSKLNHKILSQKGGIHFRLFLTLNIPQQFVVRVKIPKKDELL